MGEKFLRGAAQAVPLNFSYLAKYNLPTQILVVFFDSDSTRRRRGSLTLAGQRLTVPASRRRKVRLASLPPVGKSSARSLAPPLQTGPASLGSGLVFYSPNHVVHHGQSVIQHQRSLPPFPSRKSRNGDPYFKSGEVNSPSANPCRIIRQGFYAP